MPMWVMKCSICDRQWELERDLLPMSEVAPQHEQTVGAVTYMAVPCPGSREILLQTRDPQKR